MLIRIGGLLLTAALTGCTTIDVKMTELHIRDQIVDAANKSKECYARIKAQTIYAPVYEKIAVGSPPVPPTPLQLNDTERVTDDMLQLGMRWYSESQMCDQQTVESYGRIDPDLGVYMVQAIARGATLYQEVLTNRPTYGYINQRLVQGRATAVARAKEWGAKLDARLRQQKAEQDAALEANKQQFMSALGGATEIAANVFLTAVQVLADRQAALAQAQQQYVIVRTTYQPVHITKTSCRYSSGILNCRQVSY